MFQWEFNDPKMEVLYHIRPYFLWRFPCLGLKNRQNKDGRYLHCLSDPESWPLNIVCLIWFKIKIVKSIPYWLSIISFFKTMLYMVQCLNPQSVLGTIVQSSGKSVYLPSTSINIHKTIDFSRFFTATAHFFPTPGGPPAPHLRRGASPACAAWEVASCASRWGWSPASWACRIWQVPPVNRSKRIKPMSITLIRIINYSDLFNDHKT